EDGPYIELMTGVYTDNQPDFSWLQPYEEKTFVQYFMPYHEVGMVKNATKEAVVSLEINGSEAEIRLYVTSAYEKIKVDLVKDGTYIFTETISAFPESPYLRKITLGNGLLPEEIKLLVTDLATGKVLVSYQNEKYTERPVPPPAQAAKRPADVENNEQLFLTGQHLEQYRHATYQPAGYYEEALRRDPGDARNNNALGLWYLRRGCFEQAVPFFKKAIETITQRNPNPYDGEPYYNLGCALQMQHKEDEAYDAFYKSTWNDAWQHAGYLHLARIATMKSNYEEALAFIEKSLVKHYHSHTARHARVFILRKLGEYKKAQTFIDESLELDPFNFGCLFEKYVLLSNEKDRGAGDALDHLKNISRNNANNFIEYAFDYAHAGLYEEAIQLLSIYKAHDDQHTLIEYYLGWLNARAGNLQQATEHFHRGASLRPDYVFPNKTEDVPVLKKAIELNSNDANAYYYLGNFWFDKRQYNEAMACWERSVQINDGFATAHRNLSLAYYNKRHDALQALRSMEKAFSLDTTDARVLMELDQLYKNLNRDHTERLQRLNEHLPLVEQRDDLYLERITLYNQLGEHAKAKQLLSAHTFHPREGGEGKVAQQH
ncbi:MAG TPA: tetratricopeptide repeat protein, partial [Agriterribacter sp.]|nr:tetratricopeptide repeat protein [Agriterribacter sp.]